MALITNSLVTRWSLGMLAGLLTLLSVRGSAAGSESGVLDFACEKYGLPNGLDVILHQDSSLPMVCVNLWYHAGTRNEKPGLNGLAHLCEHLMGQGSVHSDTSYIAHVSRLGGNTNAATWEDATAYWVSLPANQLEAALWLHADMMGFLIPALTQEKLDNEREVVLSELRQIDGEPYAKQDSILKALLFPPHHPYARRIIGTAADLRAITLADVTDFYQRYYTPNNASLCIAGDFAVATAREMVARLFGSLPPGPPADRLVAWTPRLESIRRALAADEVELPRLYCAWHVPAHYQTDDAAIELLADILAGGKASRLHRSLVLEREIALEVTASREPLELGGLLRIQATARTGHSLTELEAAIDEELRVLLQRGATKAELQRAQIRRGTEYLRRLEPIAGFGGRADLFNECNLLAGDPRQLAFGLERYRTVSTADLLRTARWYLDPGRRAILHLVPSGRLRASATEIDRAHPPEPGPARPFAPPEIQQATLENGLELYVIERHTLPLVQAVLTIHSGWAADPQDLPGVSSLTTHLLDEGTRSRNALEIADTFSRLGADWRPISSFDRTLFSLGLSSRHLTDGLQLLGELILTPTFPADELERLRRQRLDQLRSEAAVPHIAPIKMLQRLIFGAAHPYAQPYTGSGTAAALQGIRREDLLAFHQKHYLPNNSALVLAGDITLEEARRLVEQLWRRWKPGALEQERRPAAEPASDRRIYLIDRPGVEQSVLLVGQTFLPRGHADYLPATVLNDLLGGQHESRINMNLRERKGFSYGYRTLLLALRHGGLFLGVGSVDTEQTAAALTEILREIHEIRTVRPPTEGELRAEKDELIQGFPDRFTSLNGLARQLVDLITYDQPLDSWRTHAARVAGLTLTDLRRIARERLDEADLQIVIAGDRAKIESALRALHYGAIEIVSPSAFTPGS